MSNDSKQRNELRHLGDAIEVLRARLHAALDDGADRHLVLALAHELRELQDRLAELEGFPPSGHAA